MLSRELHSGRRGKWLKVRDRIRIVEVGKEAGIQTGGRGSALSSGGGKGDENKSRLDRRFDAGRAMRAVLVLAGGVGVREDPGP